MEAEKPKKAKTVPTNRSNKWGEDVPGDIMRLIMKKLAFSDQSRSLSAFRRWQLKDGDPFPPPAKQLPWRFYVQYQYNNVDSRIWSFTLYDPLYKKTYPIDDTSLSVYLESFCHRDVPQVWLSKEGWLLISYINYDTSDCHFFFYSPFAKVQIELPKLSDSSVIYAATCSSSPTSSDCIVFDIIHNTLDHTVYIRSCHLGENSWNQTTFTCSALENCVSALVYLKGMLYMTDTSTKVVAFNLSNNTWIQIDFPLRPVTAGLPMDLMESGGELLLVYISKDDDMDAFKLVNRLWARVESLGNRELVCCSEYSISWEGSQTQGRIEGDGIYFMKGMGSRGYHSSFFAYYDLRRGKKPKTPLSMIYPPVSRERKRKGKQCLIIGYVEPPILSV